MAVLSIERLNLFYQNQAIIHDLDLQIKEQERICIIGKSGCGKTTLLQSILGAAPYQGQIQKPMNIAYMPQNDLLFPWLTIFNNLKLVFECQKSQKTKQEISDHIDQILTKFDLIHIRNKYPLQLSGGMKKRVSLIRAILTDAPLLLLDEPFSALDVFTKQNLLSFLLKLLEHHQKALLFVTHDLDEALFLSDRILLLQGQPASITQEFLIHHEATPSFDDLLHPKFIEIKQQILQMLSNNNSIAS